MVIFNKSILGSDSGYQSNDSKIQERGKKCQGGSSEKELEYKRLVRNTARVRRQFVISEGEKHKNNAFVTGFQYYNKKL